VGTVPPAALAKKLYPDIVRRELLEGDCETKAFYHYDEYHDTELSAEEQRRIAGYVLYETEMLNM
jgi:hypothetical protein